MSSTSGSDAAGARADEVEVPRRLRTIARITTQVGGPLFALGVILHPARDGDGIAAIGDVYATAASTAAGLVLLGRRLE